MNVRAHMSMVFHLDKCIGCNTCTVACKNVWTDRRGAEYMWWNNVETRPGTGYPTRWEDQEHYRGGWNLEKDKLKLKLHSKPVELATLFYNPALPSLDDYYEPFTFRYQDLFNAPSDDDQPVAIPISMITEDPIDIKAGPNWDDDLSGSNIYARSDTNLENIDPDIRARLEQMEGVVMQYIPRICNHCLNPSCVAACPSGAIYKRAEDGIVLVNENKCRGWRMCVAGCPYKKVYFNWATGKAEKCILCYPLIETGQAPACSHSCVGRIRYMGPVLYDADQIPDAALKSTPADLINAQREMILDPFDADVIANAEANHIESSWIDAAQRSPAYRFIKEWKLALPLHPEFRTMAMMYYVPPLSPVLSILERGLQKLDIPPENLDFEVFDRLDSARVPIKYLANMFSSGDEMIIRDILKKMIAVRIYKRHQSLYGEGADQPVTPRRNLPNILAKANTTPEEIESIYRLTTLADMRQRFVLTPYHREESIGALHDPLAEKGETGLGYLHSPKRGE